MLAQTDKIDLVTQTGDTARYQLVLVVENGEWQLPQARRLLQEKVNAYLIYALDGQLQQEYPDAKPNQVELIINFTEEPPEEMRAFLKRTQEAVVKEGIPFHVLPL